MVISGLLTLLQRLNRGRHKEDLSDIKTLDSGAGYLDMAAMDGIKGSTKEGDLHSPASVTAVNKKAEELNI